MSEDRKPPPWPHGRQDYARLGELANWVEDHLAAEHQKLSELRDERIPIPQGAADDEIWLTRHERQMLIDAFEKKVRQGEKRWAAVAAHLRSPNASRRFREIVSGLIEHDGFAPRRELGQEFLKRVSLYELYQSVHNILDRDYPQANDSDFYAKWLTVVLSDKAEAGVPDHELHRDRHREANKFIKGFNKRYKDDKLYEIVYSVWFDHAQ